MRSCQRLEMANSCQIRIIQQSSSLPAVVLRKQIILGPLEDLIRDLEFEVAKQFKTWIEQVEKDGKVVDELVAENDSGMLITVFEVSSNCDTRRHVNV